MAKLTKIYGMKKVLGNLKKADARIFRGIGQGMKIGGLYLQAKSQEIVPVDLGPLKASAFTRSVGTTKEPEVIVGYTANYAVFVHEDMSKAHGQAFNIKHRDEIASGAAPNRGDDQQAKFLERPSREERSQILDIIYSNVKI